MSTDLIGIWNLALSAAGARDTVSSPNEQSKPARECALQYLPALEAVLQAAHWNFARAQVSLALLKDATKSPPDNVPSPWLYEYQVPADCVQARYVMPIVGNQPAVAPGATSMPYYVGPPVSFLISSDLDAQGNRIKVILTNQAQAVLVYTARITDPSLFDGQFTLALSAYLAHRLTIPLSGDKQLSRDNFQLADSTTKAARASNGNEGLTVIDSIPDWIRVRGYASDWAYPPGSMFIIQPNNLTQIT